MPNQTVDLLWFIDKGSVLNGPIHESNGVKPAYAAPSPAVPDLSQVIESRHRIRAAREICAPWEELP